LRNAKLFPELEHLFVFEQHVTARFQIIVFANVLAGNRFTDSERMPFLNKRDIVHDENAVLGNRSEVLDDPFRTELAIAATIKSPGAAK
jgi:hypothetical protein